jgi:hypothetical protein
MSKGCYTGLLLLICPFCFCNFYAVFNLAFGFSNFNLVTND